MFESELSEELRTVHKGRLRRKNSLTPPTEKKFNKQKHASK